MANTIAGIYLNNVDPFKDSSYAAVCELFAETKENLDDYLFFDLTDSNYHTGVNHVPKGHSYIFDVRGKRVYAEILKPTKELPEGTLLVVPKEWLIHPFVYKIKDYPSYWNF